MKPKILILASYANSLVNFRLAMMQAFINKGFDVIACAPSDSEVERILKTHHIQFIPLELQRTGLNPLRDSGYLYKLYRLIRVNRPDIIFSYTIKPVIYGSLIGKIAGVKNIYSLITGLGYAFSQSHLKGRLVNIISQFLFKKTLKYNRKIFFQNEDNLRLFLDRKLIKNNSFAALINGSGVDTARFSPCDYPQDLTFLMIARLLKDKGVREYCQAASKIKSKFPAVQFFLVGWLDTNPASISKAELQAYIDSGVITFLGKLDDVRPAIARSSVYVLPSYGEGTPRSVLEAMSMARPIITTDVPGCRQTIVHNQNGFLVPAKNVDNLVAAMIKFIDNPGIIAEMGLASRQIAIQKYEINKVNLSILEAMQV